LAYCFPEGAPKCDVDVPKHESNKAKSGRAPYTIVATAPKGSSSTGQTVTVTISGVRGRTFKGFILSARAPNTRTNIGKFTASANTKTLECNASTVSFISFMNNYLRTFSINDLIIIKTEYHNSYR
jgi:hypothetical protein